MRRIHNLHHDHQYQASQNSTVIKTEDPVMNAPSGLGSKRFSRTSARQLHDIALERRALPILSHASPTCYYAFVERRTPAENIHRLCFLG